MWSYSKPNPTYDRCLIHVNITKYTKAHVVFNPELNREPEDITHLLADMLFYAWVHEAGDQALQQVAGEDKKLLGVVHLQGDLEVLLQQEDDFFELEIAQVTKWLNIALTGLFTDMVTHAIVSEK